MRGLASLIWLPALVAACGISGCRRGEVLGRVEGVVSSQGKPVAGACILFQNPEQGVYILAELDAGGRYRVEMDKGYGLPLGTYEVSLSPPPAKQTFGPEVLPADAIDEFPNIPMKYRDPKTSGLVLEVKDGAVNQFDVTID